MRRKRIPFLPAFLLLLLAYSCSRPEIQISTTGNKGYTDTPIVSFKAMDANGEWINADIDENDRNINFVFRAHSSLEKVTCRIKVDPEWGSLIFPETDEFELNLNAAQVITVNDGVDDIRYRVSGEIAEPLDNIIIEAGSEKASPLSITPEMTVRLTSEKRRSTLEHASITLVKDPSVVLISPEDISDVDLNGKPLQIKVYDKRIHHEKTYTISAIPAASINTGSGSWEDVSVSWGGQEHNINLPDHISIYKTESLHGSPGRIGWAVVLNGGMLSGGLSLKESFPDNKVSLALHANPDYKVFVPYQGVNRWSNTPGKYTGNTTGDYINPLVWTSGTAVRNSNWGSLPTLGIKDGKAEIRYAYVLDGSLYSFAAPSWQPKAQDGMPWDVDMAVSGCLMLVQGGENLIGGTDARSLDIYRNAWTSCPNAEQNLTTAYKFSSLESYLTARTGRTAIGCTQDGSVVIFQSERLVNMNGANLWYSTPDSGSTANEVARELVEMGCVSGALWEENYWNIVLMQDDGAYHAGNNLWGVDFFPHKRRVSLADDGKAGGTILDNEFVNLYVLMLK